MQSLLTKIINEYYDRMDNETLNWYIRDYGKQDHFFWPLPLWDHPSLTTLGASEFSRNCLRAEDGEGNCPSHLICCGLDCVKAEHFTTQLENLLLDCLYIVRVSVWAHANVYACCIINCIMTIKIQWNNAHIFKYDARVVVTQLAKLSAWGFHGFFWKTPENKNKNKQLTLGPPVKTCNTF